jgi:hypothetical protein
MTDDARMTWGFIFEILDVLDRHGYRRSDSQHTGQAFGLLSDLTRTYEGAIDVPRDAYAVIPAPAQAAPKPPDHADHDAVVLSAAEVKTVVAALDEAALYKRDRVAMCADCADQSCGTCQWRLQAAIAYDRLTTRLLDTAAVPPADIGRPPGPEHTSGSSAQPHQAGKEAANDWLGQRTRSREAAARCPAGQHVPALRLRDRRQRQRLGQRALPGRRRQPLGRPAHRQRPPARSRARSGSRTMTATESEQP